MDILSEAKTYAVYIFSETDTIDSILIRGIICLAIFGSIVYYCNKQGE